MDSLRRAGFAVASAVDAASIPEGLVVDAVVMAADVDVATRDGVMGRLGPVPLVRDDGDEEDLVAALRRVASDARPLVQLGDATVDLRTRSVLRHGDVVTLSDKESALLAWLLARDEAVVSRSELLVNVWGYHPDSTTRTVDVTLGRLRDKVEADPRAPEHLLTVRGAGYRLVGAVAGAVATRVPRAAPDDVFGRQDDLQRIADVLQRGRVVTLLGPPGVGKTTLGRAVLDSIDGVFVELAAATTEDGVRSAMFEALGLPLHDLDADRVAAAIATRGCQLVVLDNAEQVTDPLVRVHAEWVQAGVDVAWLVTTRLRLRVGTERIIEVNPLGQDPAVELFLARARSRKASYARADGDMEHVRGLVSDLEYLPLAIELAAARIRLFTPRMLRQRIARSLAVLRDDRRDRTERQKTLTAAVAWSWELLSDAEKAAMMQLSVVVGGIDVADAEWLVDVGGADPIAVLEALVDHSLARVDDEGRLTQLVCIREFARDEAQAAGVTEAAHRRHAQVFRERAALWAQERDGGDAWSVAADVERDRANLTLALRWLDDSEGIADVIGALQAAWELSGVVHSDLTLASDVLLDHPGPGWVDGAFYLCLALSNTGRVPEADAWLDRVADHGETPSHAMRLLVLRAQRAQRNGEVGQAESLYEQACAIPADDPGVYARALISRVVRYRATSRLDEALALAQEGLAWTRQRGVPTAELSLRVILASLLRLARRHDASIAACESILAMHEEQGADEPEAQIVGLIGMNLQMSGRSQQAIGVLDDACDRAEQLGQTRLLGRLLGARALAHLYVADFARALRDAQAALEHNHRSQDALSGVFSGVVEAVAQRELGRPGEALATLRRCEDVALALNSRRGVFQASSQRVVTALATGDVSGAIDAASSCVSGCDDDDAPVAWAWSAVVAMASNEDPVPALDAARAALKSDAVDITPAGVVALVCAVAALRSGVKPDLDSARRSLSCGWLPQWSNALAVVEGTDEPRWTEARVLSALLPGNRQPL